MKRRSRHVPKPRFRIAGEGSIMQALFITAANAGVGGVPHEAFLHMADYIIAYGAKAADVERVGSHMRLSRQQLFPCVSLF